jgi:hypothetical protein
LSGLLRGQNGLEKLAESVFSLMLEAQVTKISGADQHKRSEDRQGYL